MPFGHFGCAHITHLKRVIILKKLCALLLVCFIVIGLCACGGNESKAPEGLQVGFGRTNITPNYSVPLQGGDYSKRWSEGVMDYCYATCIAMRSGEDTVLVYTIDIKLMSGVAYDAMKAAICKKTGVPQENIFMNATHTHSAPAIRYSWNGSAGYVAEFTEAVISAAEEAVLDLAPATAAAGYIETEGMSFVRHYLMSDGSYAGSNFGNENIGRVEHAREADGQMAVVQFKRSEGKKDVILVNFGTHPVFNGSGVDKMISADFPSPLRQYVEQNTDSLVAYFTAAAGDQVCRSNLPGRGQVEAKSDYVKYGEILGQYAIDALATLTPVEGDSIRLINRDMTYATNKENLDKTPEQMNGPYEQIWIGKRAKLGPTKTMTLRTLAVGSLGFVSAPYEMFGEQGKYIKDNSPFATTVVMTCGEGDNSYVSNIAGFEYNCYEAQVCFYARGVAEQAAKDFVSMLEELK